MDLHRDKKREEGDKGDQEEKRGNQKGRDRYRQCCFLSDLHSPEHPQRFTDLYREEVGKR